VIGGTDMARRLCPRTNRSINARIVDAVVHCTFSVFQATDVLVLPLPRAHPHIQAGRRADLLPGALNRSSIRRWERPTGKQQNIR
jgi:hypothetical protein